MDEKHKKFRELAEKRVNKTINDIRLIGNLSNRNNYSYDDDEASKICSVLEAEVKSLKAKFLNQKKNKFKL